MRGFGYAAVATAAVCVLLYGCNNELVTPVATNSTPRLAPTQPQKALSGAALTGQWSAVFAWPIVGVHMSVLPDGRLLTWTSNEMDHALNTPNVYLWDPANPLVFTQRPNAQTDIFCSSHSFLIDGRLFVAGGHVADNTGSKDGNIFDPQTSSWSQLPQMRAGRWYPSTVTLANGDIGVAAGGDENQNPNPIPEIWDGTQFRVLNGAPLALPIYPWLFLAPDGRIFNAGPEQQTRFLNPSGDGEWANAGQHINSTFRDYGTAVVYEPGKLIALGGGSQPPVNTAELVDLNVGTTWRSTASMQFARRQLNALVLADGKVLVVGGTSAPGFNTESGSVLTPELWDPTTESWTAMSDMAIPRTYHSTAVLMPDARVLSAGGGRCGGCQVNHLDAEIFSPPYLFNADGSPVTRPTITSAPTTLNRGQSFTVTTPDATSITRATLARLPSTSHAFNMNQAFVSLPATQVSDGVQFTAPPNPNLVPAGHYMLFLLNGNGVPSVAKIVQLLGTAALPAPPAVPSAPTNATVSLASSTQVTLKWNDNSTSESSFRIERCQGVGCSSFAEIALVAPNNSLYSNTGLTSGGAYSYRVRARNAAGASGYTNVASIVPNNPPTANFTSSCNALACTFTNTSTDADGTIASSSWTFGDNSTSTATSPSHTYAAGGTYSVSVTVTDNKSATNTTTKSVTVTAPPPPPRIALTARPSKVKGVQQVDLSWTGATTSTVDVYRGGIVIARPPNNTTTKSGTYRDNLNRKGGATYQYKVCEANSTTVCSAVATAVF